MWVDSKAIDIEMAQSAVDFPPCPSAITAFENAFSNATIVIRMVVRCSVNDVRIARMHDDIADKVIVKNSLPCSSSIGAFEDAAKVKLPYCVVVKFTSSHIEHFQVGDWGLGIGD